MTREYARSRLLAGQTVDELFPPIKGQECVIFRTDDFSTGDDVIYIPDYDLNGIPCEKDLSADPEEINEVLGLMYTGKDFLDLCDGDEALAERLFWYCDWQHPSSALQEVADDDDEVAEPDLSPSIKLAYSATLEEVVAIANMAGYMEQKEEIHVEDDEDLTRAIVDMLRKRYEARDESDFFSWASAELINRFKFVSEVQSMPEVTKFIALHTGHIFADTLKALRNDAIDGVVCYRKDEIHGPEEYGVWVYIQGDWAEQNIPQDLEACIEYAKKFDCDWIMFDYDVEPVKDLTVWC